MLTHRSIKSTHVGWNHCLTFLRQLLHFLLLIIKLLEFKFVQLCVVSYGNIILYQIISNIFQSVVPIDPIQIVICYFETVFVTKQIIIATLDPHPMYPEDYSYFVVGLGTFFAYTIWILMLGFFAVSITIYHSVLLTIIVTHYSTYLLLFMYGRIFGYKRKRVSVFKWRFTALHNYFYSTVYYFLKYFTFLMNTKVGFYFVYYFYGLMLWCLFEHVYVYGIISNHVLFSYVNYNSVKSYYVNPLKTYLGSEMNSIVENYLYFHLNCLSFGAFIITFYFGEIAMFPFTLFMCHSTFAKPIYSFAFMIHPILSCISHMLSMVGLHIVGICVYIVIWMSLILFEESSQYQYHMGMNDRRFKNHMEQRECQKKEIVLKAVKDFFHESTVNEYLCQMILREIIGVEDVLKIIVEYM